MPPALARTQARNQHGRVQRRMEPGGRRSHLLIARAPQFLAFVSAQVPAEAEHAIQDVVGRKGRLAAVEVHETARNEAPLFVEDEPDAPAPARDGLAAAAALRLRARRALGAVDPREAPVREARARRALKALPVGQVRGRFHQGLKQRLRPLVGRARRMEPPGQSALAKRIGLALAETQLCTRDAFTAAAALGAAARGRLEEVGHAANSAHYAARASTSTSSRARK